MTAPAPTNTNAGYIASDLKNVFGLNDTQVAAFLGNLQAESNFSPTALAKNDGGPGVDAIGIAQWEGGRRTALQKLAASMGLAETDLTAQIAYLNQELGSGGNRSGVIPALKAGTSLNQDTMIVMQQFEGAAPASAGQRQSYAAAILAGGVPYGAAGGNVQTPGSPAPPTNTNFNPGGIPVIGPAIDAATSTFDLFQTWSQNITKASFWLRVGMVLFGFILLLVAIDKLTDGSLSSKSDGGSSGSSGTETVDVDVQEEAPPATDTSGVGAPVSGGSSHSSGPLSRGTHKPAASKPAKSAAAKGAPAVEDAAAVA